MLTAYDNYKQAHACLFTAGTQLEIHQASREAVENYLENRMIWKELNHYKENGVILGEHPIFDRMRRVDEIRKLNVMDLVKFRNKQMYNHWRIKSNLEHDPNHKETHRRRQRMKLLEQELSEVNRLLNL